MTIRPRVAAKKWSGTTPGYPILVFDDNESAEERSFQPTSSGDEGGRERRRCVATGETTNKLLLIVTATAIRNDTAGRSDRQAATTQIKTKQSVQGCLRLEKSWVPKRL
jgi:hypothetical protein